MEPPEAARTTMEWRPVVGRPEYKVSSDGRVMGLRDVLTPHLGSVGYYEVHLGRGCCRRVHRLVAEAFIPNPDGLACVDHINQDKTDNRVENLRWATHSTNQMNRGAQKNNKTGEKNIHWDTERGSWRLEIQGRILGRFPSLGEAIAAREGVGRN